MSGYAGGACGAADGRSGLYNSLWGLSAALQNQAPPKWGGMEPPGAFKRVKRMGLKEGAAAGPVEPPAGSMARRCSLVPRF